MSSISCYGRVVSIASLTNGHLMRMGMYYAANLKRTPLSLRCKFGS
ncbi:unnamed protein product [Larinioides sclopetarius]|uniref:Uncharacterized protein n=1 Tax=Larinioides sclopetarius TaxID=280406 RepID=A0AAV1ZE89_9ARAC